MYKMSILLKIIITMLTVIAVIIVDNRIILWLLLFVLSFYHLRKFRIALLVIDLALVLLLGLSVNDYNYLLIFKIIYIINCLITFYSCLTIKDKKLLFKKKSTSKMMYYENNFDRINSRINIRKKEIYNSNVSINNKIEQDLESNYLFARMKYYDYFSKKSSFISWNKIDTLILLFTITIFILFIVLR